MLNNEEVLLDYQKELKEKLQETLDVSDVEIKWDAKCKKLVETKNKLCTIYIQNKRGLGNLKKKEEE